MSLLAFTVPGHPTTQGNKTAFVRGGRAVLTEGRRPESRQAFKDWRATIALTAAEQMGGAPLLAGPLAVTLDFGVATPASAPKRRRTWPVGARSGDVDKLARAVLDALTGRVFIDDAQVVSLTVTKDYSDRPGVHVIVHDLEVGDVSLFDHDRCFRANETRLGAGDGRGGPAE
jgi:crossover junction endodeoxyribonuclease RusA